MCPTAPEGHQHRVTTPENRRKIPRTPVEPRRDPAEPSERTPAEPSEKQNSSESLAEGCAPQILGWWPSATLGESVAVRGLHDLFQRHPDIVGKLCQTAPALVPALLDGLVWRSFGAWSRRLIKFAVRAKGDAPKVTEPNLRFPAVFCGFLRKSAVFCTLQMLEFPALTTHTPLIKGVEFHPLN